MLRTMHHWRLAMLALLLGVPTSWGQTADPTPVNVPRSDGGILVPGGPRAGHGDFTYGTLEDRNGSRLIGDGHLDGPRTCNLGWFASADFDLMHPHVNNRLIAPVTAGVRTDQVGLPSADLFWTVSPRIEVGYRFGQAAGELLLSCELITSTGKTTTPGFDDQGNAGSLRSRLHMNVIDLDYASRENSLLPCLDMKWRVGIRMASLFFDSDDTSPRLEQHVSNHFFGAGPHTALELWRPLVKHRVGLFGKVEGAGVLGDIQQRFEETLPGVTGLPISGVTRQSQFMTTFMLGVEAGLTWTPGDTWRFSAGYRYEHWWDATFVSNSRGDVSSQGVFLRGEWKY